ncbi:MAG: adenylosuccinate synthetase [Candidatus Obscuribacterales bacterium]
MISGHAVIGAGYGDEGKGLITDYLASRSPSDTTVVRFNGGAQAGHTVVTPEGHRHVFGHLGAGSFAGCPTHLSRFFIVNPILFNRELEALKSFGSSPAVTVHGDALVSTPIDMYINQKAELARGEGRHGSCGIGINETVTRSLRDPRFRIVFVDALFPDRLESKLDAIKRIWLPSRLAELGIELDRETRSDSFELMVDSIVAGFIDDLQDMLRRVTISGLAPGTRHVIFEGAQGLMLDEGREDLFPHVTRSRTGLTNVVLLADEFGIEGLDVTYVTRSYLTRHGAGPLPGECDWHFADQTNAPNRFQGNLRFAPLDAELIADAIERDLEIHHSRLNSVDMAVTCLDQHELSIELPREIAYISRGPSRDRVAAVREYKGLYRYSHRSRSVSGDQTVPALSIPAS